MGSFVASTKGLEKEIRKSKHRKMTHAGLVENQIKARPYGEVYDELLWIRDNRQHKLGWVAHKFREIFGGWPRPLTPRQPAPPESLLVEYLGITTRRWRARKKREEKRNGQANGNHYPGDNAGDMETLAERTARLAESAFQTQWD
jgi:hypothetical protein